MVIQHWLSDRPTRKSSVFLVISSSYQKKLQPSDTAYPRFKSRPSETELERFYTPTENERTFCDAYTRSATRLGFVLLLKAYQRLGYFVTSDQIPSAIIDHIAAAIGERGDRDSLRQYDVSQARRKHLSAVRQCLEVKPFDDDGKTLLRQTFGEAALTKEDVIDAARGRP